MLWSLPGACVWKPRAGEDELAVTREGEEEGEEGREGGKEERGKAASMHQCMRVEVLSMLPHSPHSVTAHLHILLVYLLQK